MLPDVVILDIELHHGAGNGITFLTKPNALNLTARPYVLITTNNSNSVTYESARTLGADFIMSKHKPDYSAQYVVEFIRMIQHAILLIIKDSSANMYRELAEMYKKSDASVERAMQNATNRA